MRSILRKRYFNGMIISSTKYRRVRFVQDPLAISIVIEEDLSIPELIIYYSSQHTLDINHPIIEILEDLPLIDGVINLRENLVLNNIEFIPKSDDIKSIHQYLVNSTDIISNDTVYMNNELFIIIRDPIIVELTLEDYLSLVNTDQVYARKLEGDWSIANHFFTRFENKDFNSKDVSILGKPKESALSAVDNIDAFLKAIKTKFPEIQLFNATNDRDFSYREWINYRPTLEEPKSTFSIVTRDHNDFGAYRTSTLSIKLEYSTIDLPTLISRRDQYLAGKWLNEIKGANITIGTDEFGLSVFWERDDIPTEYNTTVSQDDSNVKLFSFSISAVLYVLLFEVGNKGYPTILLPLFEIINKRYA